MNIHSNINQNFNSVSSTTNIFGNTDLKIVFKDGIHSVNSSNYLFNNHFFKSDKSYIKFAKKEFKRLQNNNIDIISEYNDKYASFNKKEKKRILELYLQTYGYSFKIPYLKRLTKKQNERFQLIYHYYEDEDIIEVIFLDLYHMIVPAADKEHGEEVKNPQKNYDNHANADLDFKDLFD